MFERRTTGRRPNRSESAPSTGEKKNWMAANMLPNTPSICAVFAISPCVKSPMSLGKTGTIMPSANMSRATVKKMKIAAARRIVGSFGAVAEPSTAVSISWPAGTRIASVSGSRFSCKIFGLNDSRKKCHPICANYYYAPSHFTCRPNEDIDIRFLNKISVDLIIGGF